MTFSDSHCGRHRQCTQHNGGGGNGKSAQGHQFHDTTPAADRPEIPEERDNAAPDHPNHKNLDAKTRVAL
ncbi:hypothetical protein [Gordonia oryzae]|uniref:hypothetical protein n=1 Tax=Gordonia oryzae TaxID=2487349 RepID=UPI000F4DFA56|nr:hypothetical protein [Gordonia oryzae]